MLMENSPQITDAEWRVMHEVWQLEPVTSSEIVSRLTQSTDWSPGTIKTLLHRLVQKGVLDFRRKGNRYHYASLFSEAECIDSVSGQLLHTVFHGQPVPMLAYLVQSARLSGSEMSLLRKLLDQVQSSLPSFEDSDRNQVPAEVR
jgi:BlaI family penicillinase repressor